MTIDKKTSKRIVGIVAISLLLAWLVGHLDNAPKVFSFVRRILNPIIIGAILAFIINIPMNWIEDLLFSRSIKSGKKLRRPAYARPISLILALIVFIAVIALAVFLIVPDIVNTIASFIQGLPGVVDRISKWIEDFVKENPQIGDFLEDTPFNFNNVLNQSINWAYSTGSELAGRLLGLIQGTVSGVFNFFMGFIFATYFLAQKEVLLEEFKSIAYSIVPETYMDKTMQFFSLARLVLYRFFTGQGIEAFILGSFTFLGLVVFQFPYAITIGAMQMVGAFIPYVGAFMAASVGAILIWVQSASFVKALLFVLMIIIIQQIEGNLIYPRVMGARIGLPSFWVLVAITLGTSLFGLAGTILSVPLATIIYVLGEAWSRRKLRENNISDHKISTDRGALPRIANKVPMDFLADKVVEPLKKLDVEKLGGEFTSDSSDAENRVEPENPGDKEEAESFVETSDKPANKNADKNS